METVLKAIADWIKGILTAGMFKEVADIKTSDQLHLPVPDAKFETVVAKPSEIQKEMVQELSKRAAKIHSGAVDAQRGILPSPLDRHTPHQH